MFKDFKFNFRYIMAVLCLVMCFAIIIVLAFVEIPEKNKDLFNILATIFFAATIQRVNRVLFPDKEDVKGNKLNAA